MPHSFTCCEPLHAHRGNCPEVEESCRKQVSTLRCRKRSINDEEKENKGNLGKPRETTILHVDDDRGFLDLFRATYSGEFAVISLPGGADLFEHLSRGGIDAVVLDYELPGRNGLELLGDIRAAYPSMPVIFYTGQGSEEVARQAFKAGVTDYFVKASADFAQKEKMVNALQKAVKQCAVEAELEEKRAMLESFIEYNPYSVMVTDSEGRPVKTNRAHTELAGMSPGPDGKVVFNENLPIPEEVKKTIQAEWDRKRSTYSLFNDETMARVRAVTDLVPLWQSGEVVRFPPYWYSLPFPTEGSPLKPFCWGSTGFSVKNARGEIVNYVLMHEDITARVEAEEAARRAHAGLEEAHGKLEEAHRDLERAHGELRAAYASVERKVAERTAELAETNTRLQGEIGERERLAVELELRNRELEDFAHMVSHDLRNNLLVMQRLMEAAALSRGDMTELYEGLLANTESLRDFVERLLTLARAGKAIGHRMKIPVALVAEKAFALAAAAEKDAELRIAPSFPLVTCDPDAMEQVFFNLFTNALVHIPGGTAPRLDVGYRVTGKSIDITVKDNGTGIAPGVLPRVFDVTCTTNEKSRFGFGLAIVKKLVEAHGGTVRAESGGAGRGAAIVITLPHG